MAAVSAANCYGAALGTSASTADPSPDVSSATICGFAHHKNFSLSDAAPIRLRFRAIDRKL